jgi:molybdopterin converting factor small subunit
MQVPLIKVTLEPKAYLRGDFGHEGLGAFTLEETVPTGSTIMELLHRLAGNYPVFRQKAFAVESKVTFDYCVVFLNGAVLHRLADLDTELKEGDKVMLIPNIYGG